jgi:exportin-7
MATFLLQQLDPVMQQYVEHLEPVNQALAGNIQPDPQLVQRVEILEGQLTWMMYMIGAIIGGLSWNTGPAHEGEEVRVVLGLHVPFLRSFRS